MDVKHTQGPWHADREGNIWRRHPSDLYQNGGSVAGDRALASVHRGWYGKDEAGFPVEANARLIAKSPEMLAMLIDVRADLACLPRALGYDFTHLPKLDALIAKATGEQTDEARYVEGLQR